MATWIICPSCEKKLMKNVGTGRYEVSHRISGKSRMRVEFCVGDVHCPRCECVVNTLRIPKDSIREEEKNAG